MADRIKPDTVEKDPYYELDPGAPHMSPEDYAHMGVKFDNGAPPEGEPDEALASEVCKRISELPRIDASRIEVEVRGQTAILTGVVADRYARERAQEAASEINGIQSVVNHLAVQRADEAGGPTLTTRMPGADNEGTTQRS
jgi:hypothetical protein